MNTLEQVILQFLPTKNRRSSKCISVNCPCCLYMGEPRPDTKMRGGIFLDGHLGYNCFNCGFKVKQMYDAKLEFRTKKFLELLGVPRSEINKLQFESLKREHKAAMFLGITPEVKETSVKLDLNFVDCDLPKGTHLLHDIIMDAGPESDAFEAYSYAVERGIDYWPYIMWSEDKLFKMNKRLIIPYMFKGRVLGYTARSILENVKKEDRYITHNPNTGKYLFGLDNIFKRRKYLVVSESPIDSILYDGVATMNFEPTFKQVQLINSTGAKPIVIPDEGVGGKKMIEAATKNGWGVFFPFWNKHFDLGKATSMFGKLFVLQSIIERHETNPIKIKVKTNLMG